MSTNTPTRTGWVTNESCELHDLLRRPMQLCRMVGLFPVEGFGVETITGLKFNVKSLYALYYVTTLVCQAIMTCMVIYHFHITDFGLENIKYVVFYFSSFMSTILLSILAWNWPQLVKKASYLESRVTAIRTTRHRYDIVVFVVILLGVLEHTLSIIFNVKFTMVCHHNFNFDLDLMRYYFSRVFIFRLMSYTEWKAVLYEVVNLQSTFTWNITDAVTMCISLYLASYFKDLNKLIEHQEKQNSINWKEIRKYYSYLVELVTTVDQNMCYLILMSFFTNLFFICIQLFHLSNFAYPVLKTCSAEDIESIFTSVEHSLYYAFSFTFLCSRAALSSFLAANINTVAQRPLLMLQNVSSSEYNIEVQRFIRQIQYTTTALSGFCFDITRGMILVVIATVIKYELVIIQFC